MPSNTTTWRPQNMQTLAQMQLLAESGLDFARNNIKYKVPNLCCKVQQDNFSTYTSCSHSCALVLSSARYHIATPYTFKKKKKPQPKNTLHSYLTVIYYSRKVSLNKCLFRGSKQISFLNTTVCSPAGHFTKIRSHI